MNWQKKDLIRKENSMPDRYWILPILIKCQPEDFEDIKKRVSIAIKEHFYKFDLEKELNPEWIKAEDSPIYLIQDQRYTMIKVGPEPKEQLNSLLH